MAGLHNGPLPTNLMLLSDLPHLAVGDKVRFLGCIQDYSSTSATCILEHKYPKDSSVQVHVDVKLLLRTMSAGHSRVGEWVNVIGYITAVRSAHRTLPEITVVYVQALLLWSAGSFDLHGYEKSLDQQRRDKLCEIDTKTGRDPT
ncbi:hypothetical protein GLAREA_00498 [Glarea lozoyensis ATCC 20868]|uniref:CST complex subunit Ten1 n=2 Tax=Glarea lozoyensis TaxID=101852 RepID=S3DSE2_GLAL2|nr:uncharacterized protein GLAREA_00498 [Glarea lozoyensis ATCC 20868]EHK99682.1 hypothetical protein M7I_4358 [Glarea lozoyensis 74030]EPE29338.1 hypothetical protein GLAREA_00498 [Glarea lozoyensis ATCC 20868]